MPDEKTTGALFRYLLPSSEKRALSFFFSLKPERKLGDAGIKSGMQENEDRAGAAR